MFRLCLALGAVVCGCADSSTTPVERDCARDVCLPEPSQNDASVDAAPMAQDGGPREQDATVVTPPLGPLGAEPGYGFEPGEPFALPEPGKDFVFVQVASTVCQDGSPSGIAVQRGSDELLIYLEGGGACFNDWTCLSSSTLFASRSFGPNDLGRIPSQGIFSDASDNPVRDWTKIFVGYCSGDVFSGAAVNGTGYNDESQAGFDNLRRMLARIVPSVPATTRVLLAGSSAGGFGALFNWVQTQEAFGTIRVDALSDSGPMFADTYLAPCLQHTWRDLWRWSETLPKGCSDCALSQGGALGPLFAYLVPRFPERRFGLMSYTEDTVIRLFYGAGEQDCKTLIPSPTNYAGPRYTQGLLELRTRLATADNFASFYVPGSDHTFLAVDPKATASGQGVFAWLEAFLAGTAKHAGP